MVVNRVPSICATTPAWHVVRLATKNKMDTIRDAGVKRVAAGRHRGGAGLCRSGMACLVFPLCRLRECFAFIRVDGAKYTVYCLVMSSVLFDVYLLLMTNSDDVKVRLKFFGGNLRRARVARAITQEELSEKAELNIRTLQYIEAGQTNVLVTTAMRLQEALGCPWHELLPTADLAEKK